MSDPVLGYAVLPPHRSRLPRQKRSATTVVCWAILLVIAIGLPTLRALNASSQPAAAGATPASMPAAQTSAQAAAETGDGEPIDFQTEMIGKYIVGAGNMNPASTSELLTQLDTHASSPDQKLAAGIVAIDLSDRSGGMKRIDQSGSPDRFTFDAFYTDHTPLPPKLVERYGFFGRLAETNGMAADAPLRHKVLAEARKTVYFSGAVFAVLVVMTIAGFGLLVTGVVLAAIGKIRPRVESPRGPSKVYIQAFTIYIGGFIVGSLLLQWLKPDAPLWLHGLMMLAVVIVGVAWPRMLNVPWSQQKLDWGLYAGNPLVEVAMGVLGYIAGLPVMAIGLLVTLLLMQQTHVNVSHPIVQQVAAHPIFVLLLASVFAPLTEETLFRGALLSHLRAGVGPLVAAGVTGLMFASVHPQGWAAIPALGSIGFVLAMIRQWRGSLLASMSAHALNNTCVMLIIIAMS